MSRDNPNDAHNEAKSGSPKHPDWVPPVWLRLACIGLVVGALLMCGCCVSVFNEMGRSVSKD